MFNNIQTREDHIMKWVCKVCGYVHEGEEAPAECPICHVGPEKFEAKEEE